MRRTPCALVASQWPGVQAAADPPNAGLPLLGGAAFERVLAELQAAVMALGFPGGARCPRHCHLLRCLLPALPAAGLPLGSPMMILSSVLDALYASSPSACPFDSRMRG